MIAFFCAVIGISVAYVMLQIYNPAQNALGALASVCMDVICIIILLILTFSFTFDNYGTSKTTRWFIVLLVATIWALFLDFLNWAFDGSLEFGHLTYWFTVGSLCMGAIVACIFTMYLSSYMEETHNIDNMRLTSKICVIMNLVSFALSFILAITGTAFVFSDGHYETGALYDLVTAIPVMALLCLTIFSIVNIKKIGAHDVFAVAGYICFMLVGIFIEAGYSIGTTYVSVAIADIFIFVMLQNEVIAQEKRNVQKWMKKSNTDELTGYYNRHAYENDIKMLDNSEIPDDFVYISVDVNSLKAVNDSFGHNAGDELIIGAADCLAKCFGSYGKIYRTGGDEFIALVNMDEEHINTIKKELEDLTDKWDGKLVHNLALSCGYVTKKEAGQVSVKQMAIIADRRMYEAKDEYYRRTGIERRKK